MIHNLQSSIACFNTKTFSNEFNTNTCIEDGNYGIRVQLSKICSAHKDERNPDGYADWKQGYQDRIHMFRRQLLMIEIYDVIANCFISDAFFFSFHYVGTSLVVYCSDEAMKTKMRVQVIKSYYVTVVF